MTDFGAFRIYWSEQRRVGEDYGAVIYITWADGRTHYFHRILTGVEDQGEWDTDRIVHFLKASTHVSGVDWDGVAECVANMRAQYRLLGEGVLAKD